MHTTTQHGEQQQCTSSVRALRSHLQVSGTDTDTAAVPRALQIIFEAWTNDTWTGPIVIPPPVPPPLQNMVPAVYDHAWLYSPGPDAEPIEEASAIYSDIDCENSAFAAAFVEIDEARRAHDGLTPGTVSDAILWAAFYRE